MLKLTKRFLRERRGSALMEIAFSLPILMVLLTGAIETGLFLMLNQKLQHSAVSLSDLTTRDEQISEATMTDIFSAFPIIMAPFTTGTDTRVIISAVGNDSGGNATIFWQREGAGSLTQSSSVGTTGNAPTLPPDIPIRDNETIIVTEVFYEYAPIFFTVIDPVRLRRTAFHRPRIGALTTVN